ncbi:MAG TPA: SIR2 family protein [Verrucomicrobiae bacterium]|nr:SIR2 family protein [Verrucomicrobiae bacterium]
MENLVRAFRDGNVILFVGGGVSMNLGLPDWHKLIEHLAEELQVDPACFRSSGDYLTLAEYYKAKTGSLAPLMEWMDLTWDRSGTAVESCAIHKLIVELAPPIIYTTNYDRWLERAFQSFGREYVRIVNVQDLTGIHPGATQIVKFHGDYGDAESIVLTETSYFDRLDFESPLDIKLRADSLSRTILFIGYSLSDINIRYLLFRLKRLWDSSRCAGSRPQSYIFLTRENPVQQLVLGNRGIVTLFSESADPGDGLREFLQRLLEAVRG